MQIVDPGDLRPAPRLAASDITITPDGKFVFVAVRDFGDKRRDAVHRYRVDREGRLAHTGVTKTDAIPWAIRVTPTGKHLLVSSTAAGTLTAYRIDDADLHKQTVIDWGAGFRDFAFAE